jgi:molecular chaperone DnaJ
MKDYYQILGVDKKASQDEIKKAYRKLSKQYHPDVNPQGEEKFKEIAEAYDILGDETKKNNYDMGGMSGFGSSAFEEFFRNMGGNNPFSSHFGNRRPAQVPDKVIQIDITPMESYKSVEKTIDYRRNISCDGCKGSGGEKQICTTCKGSGQIQQVFGNAFFRQVQTSVCPTCQGAGQKITKACYGCGGSGVKPKMKSLKFKIPHGSDSGDFFRLDGLGDYYQERGFGNLLIKINMTSDEQWEKMGNDLVYINVLDYDDLKKDDFNVPHPNGEMKLKFPEIFDTSTPLRVRGKGFHKEAPIGDLYVRSVVRFKRNFSKEE